MRGERGARGEVKGRRERIGERGGEESAQVESMQMVVDGVQQLRDGRAEYLGNWSQYP